MSEAATESTAVTTTTTTRPVVIQGVDEKETRGEVQVQAWDRKARMSRALKALGTCWVAAFVAVFIPLLHFVLVPGLLLAGPIVASVIFKQPSVVLGGKGTCPACQAPLEIVRAQEKWPLRDVCASCHANVKIFLAE